MKMWSILTHPTVQVINKEELCREEDKMFLIEKEIEIMSQLDHPNIVKLYEVYVNQEEVNGFYF